MEQYLLGEGPAGGWKEIIRKKIIFHEVFFYNIKYPTKYTQSGWEYLVEYLQILRAKEILRKRTPYSNITSDEDKRSDKGKHHDEGETYLRVQTSPVVWLVMVMEPP